MLIATVQIVTVNANTEAQDLMITQANQAGDMYATMFANTQYETAAPIVRTYLTTIAGIDGYNTAEDVNTFVELGMRRFYLKKGIMENSNK
jgi:hypothetical protein